MSRSGTFASFCAVLVLLSGSVALIAVPATADSASPITINDVTAIRPTSGTVNYTFTISLAYPSLNTVNVNYATADGTARATFDYQYAAGIVSFAPGQLTKTITVVVNGTTLHTGDRNFTVNLSGPVNGTILHGAGIGTIQDDTANPYLNMADATVLQGDGVANSAVFALTLTSASANPISVKYATANGSARAGIDYTKTTGTLKFPPGTTTGQVTVPVSATLVYSTALTFSVALSSPVNVTVARSQATGSILNDNHNAFVTVDDAFVSRPATGTATLDFPIRLTTAATFPVTVNYSTSDGSAVAGVDYVAVAGSVTIPAGSTQVVASVVVNATASTANKTMALNLSSPSPGSSALRATASGTIYGISFFSQFTVGDSGVVAPTSGTATLLITVTLTPAKPTETLVPWATADNSAIAGVNYTAANGVLTFPPNVTTETIPITVLTSTTTFADTLFALDLSTGSTGSQNERATGYGVILSSSLKPNLSITPVAVTLPTSGTVVATVTATLTPASVNTVTVAYATADGSATSGNSAYVPATGTLTFAPGATTATASATVNANTQYFGADEYFYLSLASPANAAVLTPSAYVYIQNLNKAPTLSVNNVAVYKPLSGTTTTKFTVKLSGVSPNTVTANYATGDGSAVHGTDYTSTTGVVTFAPNATTATVSVKVLGGTVPTGNRYFYLSLSAPVNAAFASNVGMATIVDGTITPYVSISSQSVTRPTSGTATATFVATLSSPSANTVTAHYATADGSALAGVDYTTATGTVTFAPGVTTKHIAVTVLARTVRTGDLYFYVSLSAPVNVLIASQSSNYGYILDVNVSPGLTVNDAVVNRPTSGTATEAFTVALSPASPNTVSVNYSTADSSAIGGTDYTPASGTLTFAPGTTTQTVNVTVLANAGTTPDRAFYLSLSAAGNAQIMRSSAFGVIVNTVAPVSGLSYLSVTDVGIVKPSSGSANETFTVTMHPASAVPVSVNYTTTDSSAVAGIDYTTTRGSLTFAAGQTSKTVKVPVTGNTLPGPDLSFNLTIVSNTAPSSVLRASGLGLIIDSQVSNRISVGADVAVIKGDSGSQLATFTVSLNAPQVFSVQVDYATQDGSARAPESYAPDAGTLTFDPGQTTATITIAVYGNTLVVPTQTFALTLSHPVNTVIGAGTENAFVYDADVFNIKGSVVDSGAFPIAGVIVTRTGNNQPAAVATTAANGSFVIPNSIGGTYTITPTFAGKTFVPVSRSVTVLGGDATGQSFVGS